MAHQVYFNFLSLLPHDKIPQQHFYFIGKKLAVLDFKIADISYFMQSLSTDGKRALLYVAVASSHCIIVVDRYYQTASVLSTACKQYSVTGPSTNQLKHYEFVWPQGMLNKRVNLAKLLLNKLSSMLKKV